MTKAMTEKSLTIQKASPEKQVLQSFVYGIFAILIFTSLCDYNPASYHSSPRGETSPLLGQFGIYLARYILSVFGFSAWLLPWVFGVLSYLSYHKTHNKEKFIKFLTLLFSMICICILANIRDIQVFADGGNSLFDPTEYEHGAGGSVGAIFYSGLPIHSPDDSQFGGFLKLWLGSLGSVIFSSISLLFCLSFHFSFAPVKQIFSRFGLLKKLPKISLPFENQKVVEVDDTVEEKVITNTNFSTPVKKWNFPWQRKENDEDLLFGDVSKNVGDKPCKTSNTNSTTSNDMPITPVHNLAKADVKKDEKDSEEKSENNEAKVLIADPAIKDTDFESSGGMEGFKVVRAAKTEKAVSYTHLTLPTICSV